MSRIALALIACLVGATIAATSFAEDASPALISANSEWGGADAPCGGDDCSDCDYDGDCGCDVGGLGCGLAVADADPWRLFGKCCFLKEHDLSITGWLNGGIMGNADGPSNHFNGPVTFADDTRGQFNQAYLILERTPADLSQNSGLYLGGRVDFLFGSDYFFTTSAGLDGTTFGNDPRWNGGPSQLYGFSMPQLYAETDYNDLRIKWGHFYTILGYEVAPAVGNFFYTHSYAMQYGQPFTHTGMLASRSLGDDWTASAGVVGGWNDFALQEGAQYLGGLTYAEQGLGSLSGSVIAGNESDFNVPGVSPQSNRTMYSLVGTLNLTDRWTYVVHHQLGVQQHTLGFNALNRDGATWAGVNQYLFYDINEFWKFGARFEWFDDPAGYLVTGLRTGNPDAAFRFPSNFYETSVGLNYKPNANLTLRPELRYDWYSGEPGYLSPAVVSPPPNRPYDDSRKREQFLFGFDAILQF